MKKNGLLKIAAVVFAITILTTCLISGTFAKYTSTVDAKAKGSIAKWDVSVTNSSDQAISATINLDKLKPGTKATTYTLNLINNSDVDVTVPYANIISKENFYPTAESTTPVDLTTAQLTNPLAVKVLDNTSAEIAADISITAGSTTTLTISISWTTTSDAEDTKWGAYATANADLVFKFDIEIIFNQVI